MHQCLFLGGDFGTSGSSPHTTAPSSPTTPHSQYYSKHHSGTRSQVFLRTVHCEEDKTIPIPASPTFSNFSTNVSHMVSVPPPVPSLSADTGFDPAALQSRWSVATSLKEPHEHPDPSLSPWICLDDCFLRVSHPRRQRQLHVHHRLATRARSRTMCPLPH